MIEKIILSSFYDVSRSALIIVLKAENSKFHVVGLTTQLSENVTFYTRLGFQKLDEEEIKYQQKSCYNYNMKLGL